jgi:hypothetical protein
MKLHTFLYTKSNLQWLALKNICIFKYNLLYKEIIFKMPTVLQYLNISFRLCNLNLKHTEVVNDWNSEYKDHNWFKQG